MKFGVATGGGGAGDARIYATGGTHRIILGSNNLDVMAVTAGNGGSVVIGGVVPATGYKLSVRGKAIAEEIVVQTVPTWPDYVFEKNYALRSLSNVESFINEHKHLPKIPSAKEIGNSDGISLGTMQAQLLEKIEELTL